MFGNLITEALNKGIQIILQHYIKPYGEITSLSIDDSTKEVQATLLLSGELQTLEVHIFGYNFARIEDNWYLTFVNVATSRDWINTLLKNSPPKEFEEKRFEIPHAAAVILKFLF
ncbi:MAG: hypothetical protein IPJ75_06775 [Ignavibacteriales bacterium]|nr:hypothetical protein [Ignavibacteriales bacterium]